MADVLVPPPSADEPPPRDEDVAVPPPTPTPVPVPTPVPERVPVATFVRRPAALLVALFAVGLLVGLVFAVSLPPWAIEDEPQHVDYVHQLANSGRVPALDGALAPSIVQSMFDDDRWAAYGQETPPGSSDAELGLAGRSYLAYHPPLPYAAMAVVDAGLPLDTDDELNVLRGLMAVALGVASALAGLLAARLAGGLDTPTISWTPTARRAALGAGLATAALPAAADAGGRVNTDVLAMVAVLAVVLSLLRWYAAPGPRRALLVGGALAVAALTRETTVVVLVPVLVALVHTGVRRSLRAGDVVRMLGPPTLGVVAWGLVQRARNGRTIGTNAFLDHYGTPFGGLPLLEVIADLPGRALLPWGYWNVPTAASIAVVATIAVGLVLAARVGLGWVALIAVLMAVVQVAIVVTGAVAGFSTVTGRLLLPTYPVLVAVAAAGWSSLRRRIGASVWIVVTVAFGLWFLLGDQLPRYGAVNL